MKDDRDRQRKRWADARQVERLDLEVNGQFARGGLGAHVEELDLRIRFLSADPLAANVRLDGDAEEWLSKPRCSPFGGREPELGHAKRATSSALLRYDQFRDEHGWTRFLALHRDGSLDFGEGGWTRRFRDGRFVPLRPVIGLVWSLAAMQAEAAERWSIAGPFEVSVALIGVEGAGIGGFAEGWRDVGDVFWNSPTCIESNVLLRVEVDTIDPEAVATDIGERIENTFGSTLRRFLANRGDFEGRFDPRF
jgi:hypothetical protein